MLWRKNQFYKGNIMVPRRQDLMGLEHEDYLWEPIRHIDNVRIQFLEEEIEYYNTLIEDHNCGHIHTTIDFLRQRIKNLAGKKEWPFVK
tara:strand:- start:749 stop:1015 length:267 start_codon:yes stop_codon:yes gene_type:complete